MKLKRIPCHITYTNEETHSIIKSSKKLSPLYNGKIISKGPRYCPSIEDKVERFADKTRHQIFLEPETLTDKEVYPNGISTSLPENVQLEFLKTIDGLKDVIITKPGYAIEYSHLILKTYLIISQQSNLIIYSLLDKSMEQQAMRKLLHKVLLPALMRPYILRWQRALVSVQKHCIYRSDD